eukprot:NODE_720_length_799_cov_2.730667_g545_i0.p4 GENE.NODE_720_length_799_cov_2.730667_g545_i0~~NODE_720_length_799_cov_2.730667_g545_i0.p4  ORF type:complete len:54 (+),score=1.94 NODE_720_length_799_cov_2.730667_g545_i0:619-780(+)
MSTPFTLLQLGIRAATHAFCACPRSPDVSYNGVDALLLAMFCYVMALFSYQHW